jgi:carboxymethylenebutenolidase
MTTGDALDHRRPLTIGERETTMYVRLPAAPSRAGVLLLHAWWGLNDDAVAYADRLVAAGFAVAAPDLYAGRLATTIPEAEELSDALDQDMVDAVALAATDALADLLGEPTARIGALGFSLGAAWALWLPAQRAQVAATVVYYGTIAGPSLSRAATPVLGHFAETDPYEPDEGLIEFERALRAANREVDVHRYPGTGHWFAEPSRDAYVRDAAELAFDRTIAFLRRHLLEGG